MYNSVWPSQSPERQGFIQNPGFSPHPSLENPLDSFNKHHSPLHTKLSWPFCHLRSSVSRTSCLRLSFYHPLYLSFPFSICRCYPRCILSFTDFLPCIPIAIPALYPKCQLIHTSWFLLCVTQQDISSGNPPAWLNFSTINALLPHSVLLIPQTYYSSSVTSQTHSHNHLFATFGSLLRPSCLLQPPLQLSHRISPGSSMRKRQTMIFLFQQLCLLFSLPLLQLLSHSSLLQMKNLLCGSLPFFYLPLS